MSNLEDFVIEDYGSSLTTLIIGDNTKIINPGAFAESEVRTVILGSGLKRIHSDAFYCLDLEQIFYNGTKAEFEKIELEDDFPVEIDDVYYYSEEKTIAEGCFWHYVDGVATAWELD